MCLEDIVSYRKPIEQKQLTVLDGVIIQAQEPKTAYSR